MEAAAIVSLRAGWLSVFFLLFSISTPQLSAQGGKAMPVRVQFKRGSSGTTLTGKLSGSEQTEYSIGAKAGQKLKLSLHATPPGSVTVKAKHPNGMDLPLHATAKQEWAYTLPKSGDYELWVARSAKKPGTSHYELAVTIR